MPKTDPRLAQETAIGYLPIKGSIDREGLSVSDTDMVELKRLDKEGWLAEMTSMREHYAKFGDRLPKELAGELELLEKRLKQG